MVTSIAKALHYSWAEQEERVGLHRWLGSAPPHDNVNLSFKLGRATIDDFL